MDLALKESTSKKEEDHEQAHVQMWNYIFGFTKMAIIKCAIELKIADTIESHGSPMTLSQLSSALNCSPPLLYRILRFLTHRGIFKEETTAQNLTGYAQTPLSRLLASNGNNSMAPLLLLESSPIMLASWHNLSARIKASDGTPFEATHGKDLWSYTAADPTHNRIFNDAMACAARVITVPAILEGCGEIFEGVGSLVDVGGGNGTSLSMIVKACPWIRGINFDLPHVVSVAQECMGVQHVEGNMFDCIPKADAAFLMSVLHDWNDEDCIKILKNCKDALPKKTGKVIIVETVIDGNEEKNLSDVGLMLDMVMMAQTNKGKERTCEEWAFVLHESGFSRYTITPIRAIQSVIQAFI
ncbi:3'-hydroxy-N-methyl-(S)-coclaurine 4'-O-methyltransferase 2-like [Momordica charantia]|uniref:3'-hydroxy-N-methyl-(S)-coclaurine 4'-O-methyltransferase 2-like n=1 Tax=Momordica charantia TaxID=3673 RepID=A0A6J1C2I8_MOMCH|nr:3'-hydroxy-N-methyl-(S)-coclaurine 4'-O-methyltransferase 2-like [Momordica charantia]